METCAEFWNFVGRAGDVAWLEWAKVMFDLIKGIAWPLALFFVIFLFREQFRARIPDILQVGPTGATFRDPQPSGPLASPATISIDHPLQTVSELATKIAHELEEIIPEHRQTKLVRALAEARVRAEFEAIFANIFKSQVDALDALTKRSYSSDEVQKYFNENVAPINPELYEKWGLEEWGKYLLSQRLVDINENKLVITQKGIDFLDFTKNYKQDFMLPN